MYDPAAPASLAVLPSLLSPGNNVVDVQGVNTNFVDGQVVVGFGSSDAIVTKVNVLSPTHLSVNVTLNPNAYLPVNFINVTSGLSLIAQSQGSSITLQTGH